MVKANAYGMGMIRVARHLGAAMRPQPWAFGVAAVGEGEELRQGGWQGRILVFSPPAPQEFARAAEARLTLCLSDIPGVARWAGLAAAAGERFAMHVEIDTGMGRAGFRWEDAGEWGPQVAAAAGEHLEWQGCYTHFRSADEADLATTDEQWKRLHVALRALPASAGRLVVHSANSAASLRRPRYAADLVRPGIYLYGGRAGPGYQPLPVAAVRARLVLARDAAPGDTLGYGGTYAACRPERWGTVAIGYGDGIPRRLATAGGAALVHGRRVPLIGRISMDVLTVSLAGVPGAAPGDVVTLIGSDGGAAISVDEVAERCDTISYEILSNLGARLPRVYLNGDAGSELPL